jgi:hypothetical protein
MLDNGHAPIVVEPNSKRTRQRAWQRRCRELPETRTVRQECVSFPGDGIGMALGRCVALDLDFDDPDKVARALAIIAEEVPGKLLIRRSVKGRIAVVFRAGSPIETRHYTSAGFDILGTGSYIVVAGIHPATGEPYSWLDESPFTMRLAEMTTITKSQVDRIVHRLIEEFGRESQQARASKLAGAQVVSCIATVPMGERIADGRDTLLLNISLQEGSAGVTDVQELTNRTWARFVVEADLSRPKRNGTTNWTKADARAKAEALLRRVAEGKVKLTPAGKPLVYAEQFEAYAKAVTTLAAFRKLPPAAVKVSGVMLSLCRTDNGCYASTETLARLTNVTERYLQRVRQLLVDKGYWHRWRPSVGRGSTSHYLPCIADTIAAAEKVAEVGAWNTSEEGGNGCFGSLEEQIERNHDVGFEFLAGSAGDPS